MKKNRFLLAGLVLAIVVFTACNNQPAPAGDDSSKTAAAPKIKEEAANYSAGDVNMNGFVAYDESSDKKRPGILVVHEWWGLNDYTKSRAKQLAELGYIALAVDMYGDGKMADNPDSAGKMATPFYTNPQMAKTRFDAALQKLKTYPQTDTGKIAAIGYCFGGGMVLNIARLGDDLKGVVSFHGSLIGTPASKDLLKAKILVCHGEDDKFVKPDEVAMFKKQMDSIGAGYTFKSYPGATHAFSNPNATAMGEKFKIPIAYNAAADTASWKEMQVFFDRIFK